LFDTNGDDGFLSIYLRDLSLTGPMATVPPDCITNLEKVPIDRRLSAALRFDLINNGSVKGYQFILIKGV